MNPRHADTLPHQESMRSSVRVRRMRTQRHERTVRTTTPRKDAA